MNIFQAILELLMKVLMRGEYNRISKDLSKDGEYYKLAQQAKKTSDQVMNSVQTDLMTLVKSRSEDDIYNQLMQDELSSGKINMLRLVSNAYENNPDETSGEAATFLKNAVKALDRYDRDKVNKNEKEEE